ncbi:MAG TPA: helix-turn-helix transcriptional regulator [Armatimonadota bacterium]|jgi:hypothetical protein
MDPSERERLEAAGWRSATVEGFLGLSPDETALVEMKLSLGSLLRQIRTSAHLSQGVLARRIGSSQSRVAKMEAADASVTLDLIVRALLSAGASRQAIAEAVSAQN